MPMNELQRYAQDNRIQVVQFVKAPNMDNTGMTHQQNDALYQLLAKNLEGRSSVGVVKLPGVNRGIVIVALPGQCLSSSVQQIQLLTRSTRSIEAGRSSIPDYALAAQNSGKRSS